MNRAAASARLLTRSLRKMRLVCDLTVPSERTRRRTTGQQGENLAFPAAQRTVHVGRVADFKLVRGRTRRPDPDVAVGELPDEVVAGLRQRPGPTALCMQPIDEQRLLDQRAQIRSEGSQRIPIDHVDAASAEMHVAVNGPDRDPTRDDRRRRITEGSGVGDDRVVGFRIVAGIEHQTGGASAQHLVLESVPVEVACVVGPFLVPPEIGCLRGEMRFVEPEDENAIEIARVARIRRASGSSSTSRASSSAVSYAETGRRRAR